MSAATHNRNGKSKSKSLTRTPTKTLYTPVFYSPSEQPQAGPSSLAVQPSSSSIRKLGASSASLSDTTLKRLEQLSRMHIALAQSVPEVPNSRSGSPASSSSVASGKQRVRDVQDVDSQEANTDPSLSRNPRVRLLRQKIGKALEESNYDPSHGKWALLPPLVKLGVTSGGTRWIGARSDIKPVDVAGLLRIEESGAEADANGEGQNAQKLGWCNASTEQEWKTWERRFGEEVKLRSKIESWKKGLVTGVPDNDEVDREDEEAPPLTRRTAAEKGKMPAAAANSTPKSKKTVLNRTNVLMDPQDPLKASSPLGFPMAKRTAAASRLAISKPRLKLLPASGLGSGKPTERPVIPLPTRLQKPKSKRQPLGPSKSAYGDDGKAKETLEDDEIEEPDKDREKTTQERRGEANDLTPPPSPSTMAHTNARRISDISISDFSLQPPSFPSSQLVTSTPVAGHALKATLYIPPPPSSPLAHHSDSPRRPTEDDQDIAGLPSPTTPTGRKGANLDEPSTPTPSPSVVRTYGRNKNPGVAPVSGLLFTPSSMSGADAIPGLGLGKRKLDNLESPSRSPLRSRLQAYAFADEAVVVTPNAKKPRLDEDHEESQLEVDGEMKTPTRESLPKFIDLLASAKKEKKERLARRMKARQEKKQRESLGTDLAVASTTSVLPQETTNPAVEVVSVGIATAVLASDTYLPVEENDKTPSGEGADAPVEMPAVPTHEEEQEKEEAEPSKAQSPEPSKGGNAISGEKDSAILSLPTPTTPPRRLDIPDTGSGGEAVAAGSPMRVSPPVTPRNERGLDTAAPVLSRKGVDSSEAEAVVPAVEQQQQHVEEGKLKAATGLDLDAGHLAAEELSISMDNQSIVDGASFPHPREPDLGYPEPGSRTSPKELVYPEPGAVSPLELGYPSPVDEKGPEAFQHEDDVRSEHEEDHAEEYNDVLVPLRDHSEEMDIYTNDDDDDTRSLYAVESVNGVDLSSPTKSLSSLAGSDSEDEYDELAEDEEQPGGETKDPFALDGEFDPDFVSTQQPRPAIFPAKSSQPHMLNLSSSFSPGKYSPVKSQEPPSSGYGYGFGLPPSSAPSGGSGAYAVGAAYKGYNSQFDVNARVEAVDKLLEKDVDFDGWLKDYEAEDEH